ncbi:MAG: hypothetical protein WB646_00540 [Steroidobacteraceae bacterium]
MFDIDLQIVTAHHAVAATTDLAVARASEDARVGMAGQNTF